MFIEKSKIRDAVIMEGFKTLQIKFFLALVVHGKTDMYICFKVTFFYKLIEYSAKIRYFKDSIQGN